MDARLRTVLAKGVTDRNSPLLVETDLTLANVDLLSSMPCWIVSLLVFPHAGKGRRDRSGERELGEIGLRAGLQQLRVTLLQRGARQLGDHRRCRALEHVLERAIETTIEPSSLGRFGSHPAVASLHPVRRGTHHDTEARVRPGRAVRNRFGVTTTGTVSAVRIGPKPGHVSKILLIGWR
jgi:hypothetical protein